MKYVHLFTFLFFSLLISSCTPLRVMRVAPADPNMIDRYLYGSAIQKLDSDLASVELGYYDNDRHYLLFDISITNTSQQAFDFDPASIQLLPQNGLPAVQAIDPEVHVLSMDLKASSQDRTARILGAVALAATVTSLVVDPPTNAAADVVGDQLNFAEELAINTAVQLPYMFMDLSAARAAANELPNTPNSRRFWMDSAMRITTIRPGETALGKIAFPRTDKAQQFDILVPLGTQTLHFPFQQQIVRR